MENLLDQGITIILWLQHASPAMDAPFRILTFFGGAGFFILALSFVYWCIDRSAGARLAILLLMSNWVNASIKDIMAQPRPFQYDPRVMKLTRAGGPGLPSSHTQSTVVFWGYLAAMYSRTWFWIVAGCFMVLVPLSRLYLGVHFPTDLAGGYIIGAAMIIIFIRLEKRYTPWFNALSWARRFGIALAVSCLLIVLSLALSTFTITSAIAITGLFMGLILERRFVGFETDGTWGLRTVRYLIGIMITILIWWGMKSVFSAGGPAMAMRTVRTFLAVLWVSFGAPWLFVRIGLAQTSLPRTGGNSSHLTSRDETA